MRVLRLPEPVRTQLRAQSVLVRSQGHSATDTSVGRFSPWFLLRGFRDIGYTYFEPRFKGSCLACKVHCQVTTAQPKNEGVHASDGQRWDVSGRVEQGLPLSDTVMTGGPTARIARNYLTTSCGAGLILRLADPQNKRDSRTLRSDTKLQAATCAACEARCENYRARASTCAGQRFEYALIHTLR